MHTTDEGTEYIDINFVTPEKGLNSVVKSHQQTMKYLKFHPQVFTIKMERKA